MKLTEQQLFDYKFCPAFYEMKYIKRIDFPEYVTMPKLLNQVSKHFYCSIFNQKPCSMNDLKKKWDSICESNPQYFANSKRVLDGYKLVNSFLVWAEREKINIADIYTKYNIVIDDVELEGNLNPIIEHNGKYELLVTDFSSRMPDQMTIDKNINNTINAYAFKKMYNQDLMGIRVHNVKNNVDLFTCRGEADYLRMKDTIKGIAAGIEAGAFYPKDDFSCSECPAYDYCKSWHK